MDKITRYWIKFCGPTWTSSFKKYQFDYELNDPVVLSWNVPSWKNIDTEDLIAELTAENKLLKKTVWPHHAHSFQIYGQTDVHDNKEIYRGDTKKIGFLYYHPDSRIESLEEIRQHPEDTGGLLSQMEYKDWKQIVWTRKEPWETVLSFDPETDRILSA